MSDLSILSFAEPEILYDEPEPAPELSVVMPCLNEAETLADCIDLIQQTVHAHHIDAEIIVADNGSTDGSIEIAMLGGARVIHVADKGYGAALRGGIAAARGRYVVMGDADMSYDFGDIPKLPHRTAHRRRPRHGQPLPRRY